MKRANSRPTNFTEPSEQLALARYRQRIDRIDQRLVDLLSQRAEWVRKVGHWKRKTGYPIRDQKREQFIQKRIAELNSGPLDNHSLSRIFSAVIEESRLLERNDLIAATKQVFERAPLTRISILGLGLMGTSCALAIRKNIPEATIIGYDPSAPSSRDPERALGIHQRARSVEAALRCEVLILAMPAREIQKFIAQEGHRIQPGTLVLDLGSTKREICGAAAKRLPKGVIFIGGHPLAGKARSGAGYAEVDLFQNRPFVLVFPKKNRLPRSARTAIESLMNALGAIPFQMDASEHDRALAATSHLPQLISLALSLASKSLLGALPPLSGPAFLEMTRLAESNPRMWNDIAATNRKEILRALSRFQRELDRVGSAVQRRNLTELFAHSRKFREKIIRFHRNLNKRRRKAHAHHL